MDRRPDPSPPTIGTLGGREPEDTRARAVLLCLFVATLVGLAVGICAYWPYLVNEHRRLRPWQWVPMWLGDLLALFWFLLAIVSPSIPPRGPGGTRTATEERRRRRRAFLVSMGVALAIDFLHTAHAHWQEASDFAGADVTRGDVIALRTREGTDTTRYHLRVRFRDGSNRERREVIRVQRKDADGLPGEARKALASGRVPFPVRVSFDPGLPARCWLTDAGYDDGDRIYLFSYLVLLLQALGIANFAFWLREQHRRGRDPWWEALHRPLPLVITAAFFLLFGSLELLAGNLRH